MIPMSKRRLNILNLPLLKRYRSLVREDLAATYSRDLHKWLLVAPIIGVVTGLVITGIAVVILNVIWPKILHYYFDYPWAIVPGLVAGFIVTGLIMQFFTPDPNVHSTEEIINSYHQHQGDVNMKPFLPKLLAAVTTVGSGGSAALEGPSIYGGGAVGSWLWGKLRRFGLQPRDRRIMLISGAAAGMAAVFRAPLTGLVFALEMPYKDDLAHEALLPSLISSVVSYITMASFLGSGTLFDFPVGPSFTREDLIWSAALGLICGLATMVFDITFRRARALVVKTPLAHWVKMALGGLMTAVCGLVFVDRYSDRLIPLGPNYEAVGDILLNHHSSAELVVFGVFKMAATLFSLAAGGVSAMFVPLFLSGGSFGKAFAQSIVHSPSTNLYAAVGMAAFIAGGYKTPLTAVVFVAEATGGHAYIIPTLIGAAVAYAVSGEASVSADQRLHEAVRIHELRRIPVGDIMQRDIVSVSPSLSLRDFAGRLRGLQRHIAFPVLEDGTLLGTISIWALTKVDQKRWDQMIVRDLLDRKAARITSDCDVMEALRLLMSQDDQHMVLATSSAGKLVGVLTKTDILSAFDGQAGEIPAKVNSEP
jgi:CIC family chloride channel protein